VRWGFYRYIRAALRVKHGLPAAGRWAKDQKKSGCNRCLPSVNPRYLWALAHSLGLAPSNRAAPRSVFGEKAGEGLGPPAALLVSPKRPPVRLMVMAGMVGRDPMPRQSRAPPRSRVELRQLQTTVCRLRYVGEGTS